MSASEPLDAGALQAPFPEREIVFLDATTSTNDVVFELVARGQRNVVAFAEEQTAGRGQHGKRWESAAGLGLWFSLLLREVITPNESSEVTARAANAVAEVLNEQFSLGAIVKPPNDVYASGRKIAGILLELRARPSAPHAAILGIGINVHHTEKDFPPELREQAGSIAMLTKEPVDRTKLAAALLRVLL